MARLLDGAFDTIHGDLIAYGYIFPYVAGSSDVPGEGDEALTQNEDGDKADGSEQNYGQKNQVGGFYTKLACSHQGGHGHHSDEDYAAKDVRATQARVLSPRATSPASHPAAIMPAIIITSATSARPKMLTS